MRSAATRRPRAAGHQRRAHPHPRLHDLGDHGRRRRDGPRGAAPVGEPAAGGGTLLLDSISAAVIGGMSLFGGRGEVRGALLGSLVIATVANGLTSAATRRATIYIVTGVILLLAVTLDSVARRLQERSGR